MGRAAALSLTLPVLLVGCLYSFTGGGLPSHVRTVAVVALDNETPEPLLETEVQQALQAEVPRRLGVRLAEEGLADAVIRGVIRSYVAAPASVRPSQGEDRSQPPVVAFEVQIGYDIEIYDRTADAILWRATGQTVRGSFNPDAGETAQDGKNDAVTELVSKVIEGAQSQW